MKHLKAEQIIEQINQRIEKPFVSAKFGDLWKEHQKKLLDEGQISIDTIIDIAWKQGRRSLLMEYAIHDLSEDKVKIKILKITEFYLEESQVNKGRMLLIIVAANGQKFVASGDHYSPTYLTPYETSFDTKPLKTKTT